MAYRAQGETQIATHPAPASVKTRPKTKDQMAVLLLQDAQSPPLQTIQGFNLLNAPTRTMLAVMVETSMSNFKRSKTSTVMLRPQRNLQRQQQSFTARRTPSARLVFSLNLPFASLTLRIRLLVQEGKLMLHVRPSCPRPPAAAVKVIVENLIRSRVPSPSRPRRRGPDRKLLAQQH